MAEIYPTVLHRTLHIISTLQLVFTKWCAKYNYYWAAKKSQYDTWVVSCLDAMAMISKEKIRQKKQRKIYFFERYKIKTS